MLLLLTPHSSLLTFFRTSPGQRAQRSVGLTTTGAMRSCRGVEHRRHRQPNGAAIGGEDSRSRHVQSVLDKRSDARLIERAIVIGIALGRDRPAWN